MREKITELKALAVVISPDKKVSPREEDVTESLKENAVDCSGLDEHEL